MQVNGTKLHFDSIEDTIEAFRPFSPSTLFSFDLQDAATEKISLTQATGNGEFIVVLDSTDRENEGDLICAAENITTEQMAFMIRHSR